MSKLESAEDLKEYCLRKLGKPVINIEIADEQCYDRIDDTIEFFIERHFDGSTEAYYKLTILDKDVKNKYLTVPQELSVVTDILRSRSNSTELMNNFEYNMMDEYNRVGTLQTIDYFLAKSQLNTVLELFTKSKLFTFNNATNKLIPQFRIDSSDTGNLLLNTKDLSEVEWISNNAVLTSNDKETPNRQMLGDTVTSSASGIFGFEQTKDTKFYVRGVHTAKITINPGTYSGQVSISMYDGSGVIVKTKVVTLIANQWEEFTIEGEFNKKHTNGYKLVVETVDAAVAGGETFHVGNIRFFKNAVMLLRGFTNIDPEESTDVYNDRWVKEYATAVIKQQWGNNISKFSGVQMAGGVELNGIRIYEDAKAEINKLEERFSLEYELPIDMRWE